MLLGLLAGSTLARGSPLKGVAMTVFGLLLGMVGTDIDTGAPRFTFGILNLFDGIEIVALALGLFGIAEFMKSVNHYAEVDTTIQREAPRHAAVARGMQARLPAMIRGTLIGSLCALIPGTGPTIASFVAYATEKKVSKTPEHFGPGAIEGVACPEASTHSSVQGDFIPTMSLGIPGRCRDGAAARRADHPGHRARPAADHRASGHLLGPDRELLDRQHHAGRPQRADDRHLGEAADDPLQVPLSERAVLRLHRRLLDQQRLFQVGETLVIGLVGYVLLLLGFHPAPILLGFVLGPRFEENFRRAMLISRGDVLVFVERPISAVFVVPVRAADRHADLRAAARPKAQPSCRT